MARRDNRTRDEQRDLDNYNRFQQSLVDDYNIDWSDANVEGVTLDGTPLDGNYLGRLIENL